MENNKGQAIFLSVVGVATLLVALIGATFAYFSTRMEGAAGQQNITTAKVSNVVMKPLGFDAATDILPGKVLTGRTLEIKADSISQGVEIGYDCKIVGTNPSLTDLQYRVSAAGTAMNQEVWKPVPTIAESIFTVKPKLTSSSLEHIYNVELRFAETGQDQNAQQGLTGNVNISCELAGEIVYYNDTNQQGTTNEPSAIQ